MRRCQSHATTNYRNWRLLNRLEHRLWLSCLVIVSQNFRRLAWRHVWEELWRRNAHSIWRCLKDFVEGQVEGEQVER